MAVRPAARQVSMRSTSTTRASSPRPTRWQTSTSPLRIDSSAAACRCSATTRRARGSAPTRGRASGLEQGRAARVRGCTARPARRARAAAATWATAPTGLSAKPSSESASRVRRRRPLRGGIRLDGGDAAGRRRGDDAGHAVGAEHRGDGRSPGPGRRRRAGAAGRRRFHLPRGCRLGVAHERERPRASSSGPLGPHEGEQLLAVAGVVEPVVGGAHVDPGDLVDLVQRACPSRRSRRRPSSAPASWPGRRWRRGWGTPPSGSGTPRRTTSPVSSSGLAGGGDAGVLTGVELALGPRPVVVLRPVHEGDLEPSVATAPGQRAGGGDQ